MITRNFNLFLNAGKHIPLVINVNQYDHDEQWCFTLLNDNGEKYIPSTGAIVGIKADRLGIINSGTVNASGQVVINETEQMTAAVGKAVFELLIDDQTHGTANFCVLVEPKPGNNADFSESDLSLLQEAIDGTSAAAIAEGVGNWMDDNLEPGEWVIDSSLTVQGAAADAKKTGDEISDLKSQIEQGGGGLTSAIKQALLGLADAVGYKNTSIGATARQALYDALYAVTAISLNTNSLSFGSIGATQQLTATTTPEGGEVTWTSSDTSVATVSATGLVTSVGYGNATITATSGSLSATCSVVIAQATVTSISAVYTQGGTVYDTDSLDDLKSDLVVTASWSNGTTSTVPSTDYTLSGTLTEGTSTITVAYGGQTTTFNVTVTHEAKSDMNGWSDGVAYTDLTLVANQYVNNSTGAFEGYANWSRTGYVPCNGASTLSFPALPGSGGESKYNAFYEEDYTFIKAFSTGHTSRTVTVPSNAYYFVISETTAGVNSLISTGIVPNA